MTKRCLRLIWVLASCLATQAIRYAYYLYSTLTYPQPQAKYLLAILINCLLDLRLFL
jgi:hypothetical protein